METDARYYGNLTVTNRYGETCRQTCGDLNRRQDGKHSPLCHTQETVVDPEDDFVAFMVEGHKVRKSEATANFNRVVNQENWKNPIDALVAIRSSSEIELITKAIQFFTGSVATFTCTHAPVEGITFYLVTAAGYYKAIGT